MELSDLQKEVAYFVDNKELKTNVEVRLLDLVSEVGELSKEVLEGSDYGKKTFNNTDEWISELGDVLFSLICIANRTGIDLERALKEVLKKYERRSNKKGEISSF